MARSLIKTTLAVALLLALMQLTYWLAVRRYFDGLVTAVAPVAELRYERMVAFPPGQAGLDGIHFSVAGRDDLVLSADRLRLVSADPIWLGRWLLGWNSGLPKRLSLRLDGLQASPALLRALRQRSGVVGLSLPFEGVGCHEQGLLSDADYVALDWADARVDVALQLAYDPVARRLDATVRLDRAPSGVAVLDLDLVEVPDRGLSLTDGLQGARLDRGSFRYSEQGLLTRRNAYCAGQRELLPSAFAAAHLKQLHDWLRGHGVIPDEPVWAAYRSWLDNGGELRVTADPAPGVAFADYHEFAPEDRLRLLGLSATIGAADPVPVEATSAGSNGASFRPLPPQSELEPVANTEPDVQTAGAPVTVRAPATRPSRGRVIDFAELEAQRGQRVRIRTLSGNRYSGMVIGATADAVELQIRRYGGGARLPIARDQISRIETDAPAPVLDSNN